MSLRILGPDSHRTEDYELRERWIQALWRMEDRHFWHAARNRWISAALRRHGVMPPAGILEVGCGSGVVSRHLQGEGYLVTGVDTAEVVVRKAEQRCPEASFLVGNLAQAGPLLRPPYDCIGLFDLLEHLEKPDGLLGECMGLAGKGARFVVTVPACQDLWGPVDELSGHKRRYEPGEVTALFQRVGIRPLSEHGIFRWLRPVQRLQRAWVRGLASPGAGRAGQDRIMLRNLEVPPWPVNRLLDGVCRLEVAMGWRASSHRRGASILAVGEVA